MYGVRDHPLLRGIQGKPLLQVCFGESQLILNFEDGISMLIEADVGAPYNDYAPVDPREISGFLLSILGKHVLHVVLKSEKVLDLIFEGGAAIRLFDDSEHYESITIKGLDDIMVI